MIIIKSPSGGGKRIDATTTVLDSSKQQLKIEKGKHDGNGVVKIVPQTITITPTTSSVIKNPDSGKVFTQVSVEGFTLKGTASATDVLSGKTFTNSTAENLSGTMSSYAGQTVNVTSITNNATNALIPIPSSGYYNTSSVVSVPQSCFTTAYNNGYNKGKADATVLRSYNFMFGSNGDDMYISAGRMGLTSLVSVGSCSRVSGDRVSYKSHTWNSSGISFDMSCDSENSQYSVFSIPVSGY